ncbi:hypothetical protein AAG570_012750, partial [Ranatra chinensis]
QNAPKYVKCIEEYQELQYHYVLHTSLDVVEEKLAASMKSTSDVRELYLGLLFATEDHRIFGYVTNTRVKFIVVFDATRNNLRDNDIRGMFRKLHCAYADVVSNPFYTPGDPIESK